MAREDGSVIIKASVDVAQAEKYLGKLKSSIAKTESEIEEMTQKKSEAERASVFSAAELDAEKAKLVEMKKQLEEIRAVAKDVTLSPSTREEAKAQIPIQQQEIADQQTRVRLLQTEYNKIENSVERYSQKIEEANRKLERQTEEAGQLAREINSVSKASRKMADAQKRAEKSMARFGLRLREVIRSALVFTVITQTLAKLRDWLGKVVRTNADATAAVAKLKGAFLTLVQPLVDVIIPAFITLVNLLANVVTVAAQLVNYMFGKSAKQSAESAKALNDEMNALEGVGDAAKDSSKSLASFDEINKLSSGEVSENEPIQPDFQLDLDMSESQLQNLLGLVTSIGVAFAAWKLSSFLGGGITNLVGSLMAIAGAVVFVQGLFDAWANGVSWQNIQSSILGLTLAASGLYLLFGPMAAGIALIVGGVAMLVTGFKDAMDAGFNLQNTMMSVAGIIATGLGIAVLTGSLLPALIAGIAAVLLAITVATGHGEELLDGVRQMLSGFVEFFKGIFTGDIERATAGLADIFGGLKTTVNAVLDGIRDLFLGFFDWLDEKTGGRLHGVISFFKSAFSGAFGFIKEIIGSTIDAVNQILGGLIDFLFGVFTADFDRAWGGIKQIFFGVWNGIVGALESATNFIISGINWLISQLNKVSFTLPDWVPAIGGKNFGFNINPIAPLSIPRLATGSVVPPNREFLAVLGDNKTETEVVSPLSTMKQAMLEALRESGGAGGNFTITVKSAPGLTRYLKFELDAESNRQGDSLVGGL